AIIEVNNVFVLKADSLISVLSDEAPHHRIGLGENVVNINAKSPQGLRFTQLRFILCGSSLAPAFAPPRRRALDRSSLGPSRLFGWSLVRSPWRSDSSR